TNWVNAITNVPIVKKRFIESKRRKLINPGVMASGSDSQGERRVHKARRGIGYPNRKIISAGSAVNHSGQLNALVAVGNLIKAQSRRETRAQRSQGPCVRRLATAHRKCVQIGGMTGSIGQLRHPAHYGCGWAGRDAQSQL